MNDGGNFWSGRFRQPPSELFQRLNASIMFDWRLAPYDIEGSIAHARMLSQIGVLSGDEFEQIEDGLKQIMTEILQGDLSFDLPDEDIHSGIEKRLIELIGDTGKKLHTARSRNDQVATDLALYIRDLVKQHLSDVVSLQAALLKQADAGVDAVMPGYTHLQRAQPVLLAHHLLAYFEMFSRDFVRLWRVLDSAGVMPLGAGALAGVNYETDRDALAAELGFDRPGANSLDDVSNRDYALDYLGAASNLSVHLSRLAIELILWSSTEFGFVELADAFTSGSSIMPQKKNADACELIRAKAVKVEANHQGLCNLMAALPLAYNKDLQEDKLYVFETADILGVTIAVAAEIVGTLSFDYGAMREAAAGNFALATDVADYLVGKGVPFRDSHRIVGELVRECIDAGCTLGDFKLEELRDHSESFDETYYDVVDLDAAVGRKVSYGGTAAGRVRAQLDGAHSRLKGLEQTVIELG